VSDGGSVCAFDVLGFAELWLSDRAGMFAAFGVCRVMCGADLNSSFVIAVGPRGTEASEGSWPSSELPSAISASCTAGAGSSIRGDSFALPISGIVGCFDDL